MLSVYAMVCLQPGGVLIPTHVIQAPLWLPNAIFHAGSSDWKYSSGWKKVFTQSALIMRKHTRSGKTNLVQFLSIGGVFVVVFGIFGPASCSLRMRFCLDLRFPGFEFITHERWTPNKMPTVVQSA
jgi:hypothetical protein